MTVFHEDVDYQRYIGVGAEITSHSDAGRLVVIAASVCRHMRPYCKDAQQRARASVVDQEALEWNKAECEVISVPALHLLAEQVDRWNVRVEGYCLMPNHSHLLLTPQSEMGRAALC